MEAAHSSKDFYASDLNSSQNVDEQYCEEQHYVCNIYEQYTCPQCSKSYKNKSRLKYHLDYSCGRVPRYLCPYCDYGAKIGSNVRRHIAKKHPDQDKVVINLGLAYSNKFRIKPFVRNFYEKYTCADCSKIFKKKACLKHHLQHVCSKAAGFLCPYCDYRTKVATEIGQHVGCMHSDKDNIFERFNCANCDRSYKRRENLLSHIRNECGQPTPKYGCPHCDKRYTQKNSGLNHIRRKHPGKLIYVIHLPKSSVISNKHKKPESDRKELKCPFCSFRCCNSDNLQTHINEHEKYSCPDCGKSYYCNIILTHHRRRECEKRLPYKCTYCSFFTRNRGNLTQHIGYKHPGKELYVNY